MSSKARIEIVDPYDALDRFVRDNGGTQVLAAKALGITQSYLSSMLRRRNNVAPSILAKLGLRTAVVRVKS